MSIVVRPSINQIIHSQLADREARKDDRRQFERHAATLAVRCRELDPTTFEPAEDEFDAVTHDISEGGISLITDRRITSTCLSVVFQEPGWQDVEVVVSIARTREFGSLSLVAGPFVEL